MRRKLKTGSGFTLVELLVVIAIFTILAALFLSALSVAKNKARRTTCMDHLRQINLSVRMYSDDSSDVSPGLGTTNLTDALPLYTGYKELIKSYVGLRGASSPQDRLFACPADLFFPTLITNGPPLIGYVQQSIHSLSVSGFSSYMFNGGDNTTRDFGAFNVTLRGLTGVKLTAIKHPVRTVLVSECSAAVPWSWHEPSRLMFKKVESIDNLIFKDAKNIVSFADGHVGYIRIYRNSTPYDGRTYSLAVQYDPPADYEYQWSPN